MRTPVQRDSSGTQSAVSRNGPGSRPRPHICNGLEKLQHSRACPKIQGSKLKSHQAKIPSQANSQRLIWRQHVERRLHAQNSRSGNNRNHEKIRQRKPTKTLANEETNPSPNNAPPVFIMHPRTPAPSGAGSSQNAVKMMPWFLFRMLLCWN